jgi:hypothetical protein
LLVFCVQQWNSLLFFFVLLFSSIRLADSRRESTCAADARWNPHLKQIPDGIHIWTGKWNLNKKGYQQFWS